MAPHSSALAWKIPWTEEPGRLQSMGSLGVGHDWVTSLSLSCIGGGNGSPLQCSCLENPRDGGAWWAAVCGVAGSWRRLQRLSRSSSSCSLQPYGLSPARLLCPWGFSRQEYWGGLPCPPPGDLPNPGIKPRSPALQADFFYGLSHQGSPIYSFTYTLYWIHLSHLRLLVYISFFLWLTFYYPEKLLPKSL